jgi:hypothetical protein
MEIAPVLTPAGEGGFVAALINLREATELYLEEFPQR